MIMAYIIIIILILIIYCLEKDNTTIHSDDNITITKEFYTQMIHDV